MEYDFLDGCNNSEKRVYEVSSLEEFGQDVMAQLNDDDNYEPQYHNRSVLRAIRNSQGLRGQRYEGEFE